VDVLRRELNQYLFHELGVGMAEEEVAADRPFRLELAGDLTSEGTAEPVFKFVADGEEYYALANPMNFLPTAGMSVDDLRLQETGRGWIGRRDPVDLDTSRIGDSRVPPTLERREQLERLVSRLAPGARLSEGLFLVSEGSYLALAMAPDLRAFVCADFLSEAQEVDFPAASAWRRLSYGVGELLADGLL
jgi:hypothetical protein